MGHVTTSRLAGEFNYGQFLQGENAPASLVTLKEYVTAHGIEHMKFYLVRSAHISLKRTSADLVISILNIF